VAHIRDAGIILTLVACGSLLSNRPMRADDEVVPTSPQNTAPGQAVPAQATATPGSPGKLVVTVGKSLIIDSPLNITRVHVANGDMAEAVAVNPKEVLINGKTPGETTLIVWQQNGARLYYDLTIRMSNLKLEAARQQIARDFPDDQINLTYENDTAFLRGTVKDVNSAERIVAIAETLGKDDKGGKVVNLMRVAVPPVDPQVLLKVRFADVDRQASLDAGLNFWDAKFNQQTSLGAGAAVFPDDSGHFQVPTAVNILLMRPDIGLVGELQALQAKRVVELLAEPNLLAISGQQASFLAGGEFPFPVVQPTQTGYMITIAWREYGVRLNFTPIITPRGTIRLKVEPEVSSLDYTNAVSIAGWTIPSLATRRVKTEVELESGQTFAIAGLLDNEARDSLSKVPGIGNIPILGKLFQSKSMAKSNRELLVIITPEVVRPIPNGQPVPDVKMTVPPIKGGATVVPQHPGMDKTGPVPVKPQVDSLPVEQLMAPKKTDVPPPMAIPLIIQQPPTAPGSGGSSK